VDDSKVSRWVATTKGIDAGLVEDLMMQAVEYRFGAGSTAQTPIEWLSDNGSCYTAIETRTFAKQLGLKPVRTPVESPQSNGMAESFVKTFKRDYARLANRPDSQTVMRELKCGLSITMKSTLTALWGICLPSDSWKSSSSIN
jgi:putative transposase